ncbi:hypothetical protein NQU17_02540 [Clostridiaceae bacterium HFYG-1003]|nr:hypothetical protein NQU17_02540 [Clostridiaceae bacterium HFYG-1003]
MELFKLFGSIFVDSSSAEDSISKTEKKAEGLGSKLGGAAKVAGTAMLGMGAAIAGGGAALVGVANNAAGVADRVDKMSSKMGISKKGFQEWDYVMGQNGMSIDKMQTGMKTLVAQMDGAASGNKKSAESFAQLGVSVTDSSGKLKDQETMMNEVIMKLAQMPEGTEKARLATELFGKSGVEMAPMLATGAQGIQDLKDRSHELGLVMSDEAVTSGVVFGDTMDDVTSSLGMVATNVGTSLMPIIQTFLDWVLLNMPMIQATMSTVFGVIKDVVTVAVDIFNQYLMPAFAAVFDWVQVNWPTIKLTLETVFNAIKTVVGVAIDVFNLYLMPAFQSIFAWVQENWPAIRETIVGVFNKIKEIWNTVLKPAFDQIVAFIRDTLVPKVKELFPKIEKAVKTVFETIRTVWETILKPVFDAVWTFIEDNLAPAFSTVFDGIKIVVETAFDAVGIAIDTVTGVFEGIKTTIDNVSLWFTGLKDGITNAINAARDAVDLAIQKIKGFFGFEFKWPKLSMPSFGITPEGWKIGDLLKGPIPHLSLKWNAAGGIFDKPTIFNTARGLQGVGEAGPEAIMPLSKLQELIDWNNSRNSDRDVLMKILKVMQSIERKEQNLILDTGVLVGAVKDPINKELGRDAILRGRGL